jgi:hypothetical protein
MKTIQMLVESPNGHDTIAVPENEVQEAVEKELKDGKWVTIEKKDGNTELLAEQDIPTQKTISEAEVEKSDEEAWAEKFENVESVTATNKAKGG